MRLTTQALPYELPAGAGVLCSIDATGAIVAEIGGDAYLIQPGQSWVRGEEGDPSPECHTVTTYRLTNHGLLQEHDLEIDDEVW